MSDEIRVGDRFLVEVNVVEDTGYRHFRAVVAGFEHNATQLYTADELRASKRLPRTIKVGDRVKAGLSTAIILALDGNEAWLRFSTGSRSTWPTSDLTLADGETA